MTDATRDRETPPPPEPLAVRIDRTCDAFEAAWRAGSEPRVEASLVEVIGAEQAAFLGELLATELELRRARGDVPQPDEYLGRFPEHSELIERAFLARSIPTGDRRRKAAEVARSAERSGEDSAFLGRLAFQLGLLGRKAVPVTPPGRSSPVDEVTALLATDRPGSTSRGPAHDGATALSPAKETGFGDIGRIRLARQAAAEAQATESVRVLLRRRLRLAFLLVTGVFWPVGSFGIVNAILNDGMITQRVWLAIAIFAGPFAAFVALTILLWSRRPLSLTQLRAAELMLVGLLAMACILKQRSYLDAAPDLVRRYGDRGPTLLAGYHGLFWFTLLVTYGLFVPNSWRRSAIVVALIAACPFVVALAGRVDLPLAGRPFLFYMATLGFWAVFGALLAAFGSHHIEALRQEAGEVRELGPYRLKQRLGAGGMGEVYLAEHRLLRRPCAIKLIRPERFADPRYLDRFEREVQATAGLTHPNTVEVYDYGRTEDGTFYYVMEYLAGLTLEELVSRHGPLPPGRVVYLLRQVCDALGEAHDAGLVHRDVKPANVMVCTRGGIRDVAKLLDFGLAEPQDPQDAATPAGLVGTPAYMSPEQATGGVRPDARSDLYSLGAIGFFLLTGQPPFVRKSVLLMLAAHRRDRVEFPDHLPESLPADLQAVVLRCLEKQPSDRFADAASLGGALRACQLSCPWTEAFAWWASRGGEGSELPEHTAAVNRGVGAGPDS